MSFVCCVVITPDCRQPKASSSIWQHRPLQLFDYDSQEKEEEQQQQLFWW
jgi:hypothetical protein